MRRVTEHLRALHTDERGHGGPFTASLAGLVAGVALPWGIISDTDWLVIVGGVAVGAGLILAGAITHAQVDYATMQRLEDLEGSAADEG